MATGENSMENSVESKTRRWKCATPPSSSDDCETKALSPRRYSPYRLNVQRALIINEVGVYSPWSTPAILSFPSIDRSKMSRQTKANYKFINQLNNNDILLCRRGLLSPLKTLSRPSNFSRAFVPPFFELFQCWRHYVRIVAGK